MGPYSFEFVTALDPALPPLHMLTDSSAVVLYTFRRCPYAMRARLALHAAQVNFEHREVELKRKPPHLVALSPKATVPVLWLPGEGGRVIDESLSIMYWALQKNDPSAWLPKEAMAQHATELFERNDGVFKHQLDRYKYPSRYGMTQEEGLEQRDLALGTLVHLNDVLSQNSFFSGKAFGMIDAAIAPFIRQFARVDSAWFAGQPFKSLIGWLNDFESSELFLSSMKKVSVWSEQ